MERAEGTTSTPIPANKGAWSSGAPAEVELDGHAQRRVGAVLSRRYASAIGASVAAHPCDRHLRVDVLAVTISYILAKAVAHEVGWDSAKPIHLNSLIFLTVGVWPVVFAIYGLYDLRRPSHATAEFQRLFNALLMSALLVLLITFVAKIDISRSFFAWLLGFSLVTIPTGRLLTRRLGHALNTRAVTSQVTLIVGMNDEGRALARTLRRRPWMGYRVCGFVEVTPSGLDPMDGLPVLGMVDDIGQISASQRGRRR